MIPFKVTYQAQTGARQGGFVVCFVVAEKASQALYRPPEPHPSPEARMNLDLPDSSVLRFSPEG